MWSFLEVLRPFFPEPFFPGPFFPEALFSGALFSVIPLNALQRNKGAILDRVIKDVVKNAEG